jgi:hypothetical protein
MQKKQIRISPANRGKFTAQAKAAGMGVQAFARKVMKKGSKATAATRKRANFAIQAKKWKKG